MTRADTLDPPLTFHASFDETLDAVALGEGVPVSVEVPVEYRPGKVGQALLCGEGGALAHYATRGILRRSSGTVEMWVCPLDWTGEADEFHSFFETKDPGWLVLYRYYQGGILMLMGSDGATYSAAAGKRLQWEPGEWHHVAGTWRAKGLEIYVDGEREGFDPNPPMPEELGETFRLGDHPWHVPREKQSLIDEVKLYSAPLDAESIARAARGEQIEYKPNPIIELTVDPDANALTVACDAAGVGGGIVGKVGLAAEGGIVASGEIAEFTDEMGECALSLAGVDEGEYEVGVELVDDAGETLAAKTERFAVPGPPVWSGNELGRADVVLPPWTPLEADRDASTLACWGREYAYETFLVSASSAGTELLAEPVRLEAVIDGEAVALSGARCAVDTATETRARLLGGASGAGLRATLAHEVEYDGYTWTDIVLEAGNGVEVDELRLTWSMPADQATLVHADRQEWINNEAGSLGPDGWSSDWTHYFWVGNEERGLAWYAESDQHWVASEGAPALQAAREGDVVDVTIRLIAEPTTLRGEMRFAFGMMATPVRPRPAEARRWRMRPAVGATMDIIWPNGNMKYYGYTDPEDHEKLAAKVTADHAEGVLVVPYINLNYISAGVPEWRYYGDRWGDPRRAVTPSDVAAMGYASMGTCPNVRDWQDFILHRINEMIDAYGIDGIYIDCWSPYPCKVGGCGWTDAEGEVHPTRPVRAYREILRRAYALFAERRPEPLLMVHMSSQVDIPMLSFTHTILDGEQFRSGDLKDDYLDLMPPDAFRAEFMGFNWGPVDFFLPEFRDEYVTSGTPNLAAYLTLHDVSAWPIWSDGATWNKLYGALDEFGIAEAEFEPYWENDTDAQVLVSRYVRDDGVVLVVMNTGEALEAEIEAGMEGAAEDVLNGEAMDVNGTTVTAPLGRRQGRVIRLRRARDPQ